MSSANFAALLETFFTDRLIAQRRVSPHTVASYRDTFRLLLQFAQKELGKSPSKLVMTDLNLALKEDALKKTSPLNARVGRFKPDDQLLSFLRDL